LALRMRWNETDRRIINRENINDIAMMNFLDMPVRVLILQYLSAV